MAEETQAVVRQVRILHVGVCAGIIVFLGIAVGMQGRLMQAEVPANALLAVLALCAVGCGVAYATFERVSVARVTRVRQESALEGDGSVVAAYRQLAIVGAGLIEAPCFLACVIYMLTQSQIALVATILGVALLLSRMPSEQRLKQFMERVRGV